jgi:hypothetical protein
MPAMTVKSLSDQLSHYCSPDQRFIPVLNLVLPRLYAMGYWRDLAFEYRITTSNGYFALPLDAESIMAATVDKSPQSLWAQWHDYSIGGMSDTYSAYGIFGVVDDGVHSTKEALDSTKGYTLSVKAVTGNLPSDGIIQIKFTLLNGNITSLQEDFSLTNANGSLALKAFGNANQINAVSEIRFDGIPTDLEIYAVERGLTVED